MQTKAEVVEYNIDGTIYAVDQSACGLGQYMDGLGQHVVFTAPVLTIDGVAVEDVGLSGKQVYWDVLADWGGEDSADACDWSKPYTR